MNEQTRIFISDSLTKGISIDEIKKHFSSIGKSTEEVEQIFKQYNAEVKSIIPENVPMNADAPKQEDECGKNEVKTHEGEEKKKSPVKFIAISSFVVFVVISSLIAIRTAGKTSSEQVKRSFGMPAEIHERYLPIWENIFIMENGIDKDFFDEHVFPKKTGLNKENELGEEFVVDFEYKVDWATVANSSSIIIKPKGNNEYLNLDEIVNGISGNVVKTADPSKKYYIQTDPILPITGIIAENEASEIVKTCRSDMKPASKPFKISPFSREDDSKVRLLYRSVRVLNSSQVVMAEVDLETGEINCYDADIKFN